MANLFDLFKVPDTMKTSTPSGLPTNSALASSKPVPYGFPGVSTTNQSKMPSFKPPSVMPGVNAGATGGILNTLKNNTSMVDQFVNNKTPSPAAPPVSAPAPTPTTPAQTPAPTPAPAPAPSTTGTETEFDWTKFFDKSAPGYVAPNTSKYDAIIEKNIEGPDEAEIQKAIKERDAVIDAQYKIKEDALRRDIENRKQETFSNLAGVGFNPLSSGSTNLQAASDTLLQQFLGNLEAEKNAEKSNFASTLRKEKTEAAQNATKNAQNQRDYMTKNANEAFARDTKAITDGYQNMMNALTIQKTRRDLSQGEKNDQWTRLKDQLGIYGSAVIANMDDTTLRALEKSAGLMAGTLNPGSKTLAEIVKNAAADKFTTVAPGATLVDANGNPIYTAPDREKETAQKIVKINGEDYVQNPDGSYTRPQVPEATKKITELQQSAIDTAQSILDNFRQGRGTSAVGGNILNRLGPVGDWLGTGTDRAKFVADFDNLMALLALDDVKHLKGQGAVSDAERALLQNAASGGLRRNLGEPDFEKTLSDIITTLKKNIGTTQNPAGQDNTALREQLKAEGYSQAEIDQYAPIQSFSKVGSDTNQAVTKVAKVADGTKGGQCGSFIYRQTGFRVGDTYQSKLAKMDPTITTPQPGMVFTMPYRDVGHIGMILDIKNGVAKVKDSNYNLDEKVTTHYLPVSKMTGFAYA